MSELGCPEGRLQIADGTDWNLAITAYFTAREERTKLYEGTKMYH